MQCSLLKAISKHEDTSNMLAYFGRALLEIVKLPLVFGGRNSTFECDAIAVRLRPIDLDQNRVR